MKEKPKFSPKPSEKVYDSKGNALDYNFTELPKEYYQQGTYENVGNIVPKSTEYTKNIQSVDDYQKFSAEEQSVLSQWGNAAVRTTLNTIPEIVKNVAYMEDLFNYKAEGDKLGNSVAELMTEIQESVNESLPIYTKSNEAFAIDDFGWWAKSISSLATSASAFAATGAMTGGALNLLGNSAARLGWVASLGDKAKIAIEGAKTLGNAYALNRIESLGIGVDVYNATKQDLTAKVNRGELSLTPEEIEKRATEGAYNSQLINSANVLLNLTSASKFLKANNRSNQTKELFKISNGLVGESVQEAGEELINLVGEKSGKAVGQGKSGSEAFNEGLKAIATKEGLESAFLGALGGFAQTGLVNASNTSKYNPFSRVLDPETGQYISAKEAQNKEYYKQLENKDYIDSISKALNIDDTTSVFTNVANQSAILEQIEQAEKANDIPKMQELGKKLIATQAFTAFENGNADYLVKMYEDLGNAEPKQGMDNNPDSPEYYKTKAKEAVETIRGLEKAYNKSSTYLNKMDVYNNLATQELIKKKYNEEKSKVNSLESNYMSRVSDISNDFNIESKSIDPKTNKEVSVKVSLAYDFNNLENTNYTGEQLDVYNTFLNKVKNTQEYKDYTKAKELFNNTKTELEVYEEEFNNLTKNETQDKLKNKFKELQEVQAVKKNLNKLNIDELQDLLDNDKYSSIKNDINTALTNKKQASKANAVTPQTVQPPVNQPVNPPVSQPVNTQQNFVGEDASQDFEEDYAGEFEEYDSIDELNATYNNIPVEGEEIEVVSFGIETEDSANAELDGELLLTDRKENTDSLEEVLNEDDKIDDSIDSKTYEGNKVNTGWNKIAYLSREFETVIRDLVVGKKEISNELNAKLFKPLLNPDKYGANTEITLKPIPDFDGNIYTDSKLKVEVNWKEFSAKLSVDSEEYNKYLPIGVFDNDGNVIGYLHNSEWMNAANLSGSDKNFKYNARQVQLLRERVIKDGQLKTTIKSKSWGKLFKTKNNEYLPANELMPDTKQIITVYDAGKNKFLDKDGKILNLNILNKNAVPGQTYALAKVSKDEYIAIPLSSNKVSNKQATSIANAIKAWSTNDKAIIDEVKRITNYNPVTKEGIDLSSIQGLSKFIELHVHNYAITGTGKDSFTNTINDVLLRTKFTSKPIIHVDNNENGFVKLGKFGITNSVLEIKKGSPITPDVVAKIIDIITDASNGGKNAMYVQTSKKFINTNVIVPSISDTVNVEHSGPYSMYVKSNSKTNVIGHEVEEGVYTYTVQPVIRLSKNPTIERVVNTTEASIIPNAESSTSSTVTTESSTSITSNKDIDAQIAELEKRKQEELNEYKDKDASKVEEFTFTDEEENVTYVQVRHYPNGKRMAYQGVEKNKYGNVNDNSTFEISKEQSTEDYLKVTYPENSFGKYSKTGERTGEESSLNSYSRKINAKYDAEIAELESQKNKQTEQTGVVPPPPDIEVDFDAIININGDEYYDTLNELAISGVSLKLQNQLIQNLASRVLLGIKEDGSIKASDAYNEVFYDSSLTRSYKALDEYFKQNPQAIEVYADKHKQLLTLESIFNNKRFFIKKANEYLTNLKVIDSEKIDNSDELDDDEIIVNDEAGSFERLNQSDDFNFTLNTQKTISGKLKQFMAFIPDAVKSVNANGETSIEYKNSFMGKDYPIYVPFNEVYNTLHSVLEGIQPSIDDVMARLEEINTDLFNSTSATPNAWISNFIDILEDADIQIKNELVSDMTKSNNNMKYVIWKKQKVGNNIEYVLSVSSNNDKSVENELLDIWNNLLLDSPLVVKNNDGEYFIEPNAYLQLNNKIDSVKNNPTINDLKDILLSVGINATDQTLTKLFNTGLNNNSEFKPSQLFAKNGLVGNIVASLNKFINSPMDYATPLDIPDVKKIARIDAKYQSRVFAHSFRVAGKSIYAYNNNMLFTRNIQNFNNPEKRKELLEAVFSRKSTWANNMLEAFTVSLDPFKKLYSKNTIATELKNKSSLTHELAKIGYFTANAGKVEGTRRAHLMYFTTSDKSNLRGVVTNIEDVKFSSDARISDELLDKLYDLIVMSEYDRMQVFSENSVGDKLNIDSFNKAKNYFYMLPELNTTMFNDKTVREYYLENKEEEVRDFVKNLINQRIVNDASLKLEFFNKYGIGESVVKGKKVESNVFVNNNYVKDIAAFKPDNMSVAEYLAYDMVVNYYIANANMQLLFVGDPVLYFKKGDTVDDVITNTYVNLGKRLAGDVAPGIEAAEATKNKYYQVMLNDWKGKSKIYDEYVSLLGNDSKPYSSIESTDAQEFTTWKEHLYLLRQYGRISDKDFNKAWDILSKELPIPKELELIFQPLKPVVVDNILTDVNGVKYMKRVYVKSSSFPLIPQLTKGLEINKLRLALEKLEGNPTIENVKNHSANTVRAAFKTAVKVGFTSKAIDVFNANGTVKDDLDKQLENTDTYIQLNRTGFRIQQEVPYKFDKDKIGIGTQESKLVWSDLFDGDTSVDGFTLDGKPYNARELKDLYDDTYKEIYKQSYESLLDEINPNGKLNIAKVKDILYKEAVDRGYSFNDKKALELNESGTDFKIPLYLSPSADKYMALLNSIVSSRVVKQKLPGRSFVLGSEEGFIEYGSKEANEIIETSNILYTNNWDGTKGLLPQRIENGVVKGAQVLITSKFVDSEGNEIDLSRFVVNGKIDPKVLPTKMLEMFGFRIPTQGLNSMAALEVVGFLPKEMGDLIIAPKDFTKQMGSDFDIDKLYCYTPEYLFNYGKFIKKKSNKNTVFDIHLAVMKNPNVQKSIKQALGFGDLKFDTKEYSYTSGNIQFADIINDNGGIADAIDKKINVEQDLRMSILNPDYQKMKYLSAAGSKTAVGVFSLDVTFHAVAQSLQKPLKLTNRVLDDNDNLVDIYDVKFGDLITKGYLGRKLTLDNKKPISEVLKAFQSAALDDEKEKILSKVNLNSQTFDVVRTLAMLGFNEDLIITFINQDIIKEYIEEINTSKSELSDYNPNAEKDIIFKLTNKYAPGFEPVNNSLADFTDLGSIDNVVNMLYTMINNKDIPNYGNIQVAILNKFLRLKSNGMNIASLQSTINSDSAGVGKSIFYSLAKEDKILGLGSSSINNAEQLIGEFAEEGEFTVNDTLSITPKGIPGYTSVYGVLGNNKIWKPLFNPLYDNANFLQAVNELYANTTLKNDSSTKDADNKKKIFNALKSYTFSRYFEFNKENFLNNENNFAKKVIDIVKNTPLKDNTFLNKLSVELNLEGNKPLFFKFNAGDIDELIDTSINEGFITLFMDNNIDLSQYGYNSTKDLAKDLVAYSYVKGGIQGFNDFTKYIPVNYLFEVFNDVQLDINSNGDENSVSNFTIQYIQHNPEIAPKVNKFQYKDRVFTLSKEDTDRLFVDNKLPLFVSFSDDKTTRLFVKQDDGYVELDILGNNQFNEYAYNQVANSIIADNKAKVSKFNGSLPKVSKQIVNEPVKPKEYKVNVSDALVKIIANGNEYNKKLALEFSNRINLISDYSIEIRINDKKQVADGGIFYNDKKIIIEMAENSSLDSVHEALLHEITHAFTTKASLDPKNEAIVNRIKALREKAYRAITKDPVKLANFKATTLSHINALLEQKETPALIAYKNKIEAINTNVGDVEKALYSFYSEDGNVREFMAVAMSNKEFQQMLSEIPAINTYLLSLLKQFVVELLNALGFSKNSLAAETVNSIFELIDTQENNNITTNTTQKREYTPENITSLKPNEVFVFGANTAGGHGGGTAGLAQRGTTSSNYTALPVGTKGKWAEYGVVDKLMQGTEGKSFGIVTKSASISGTNLKIGSKRSVPLSRIEESINALIKTANENPNLKFLVTKFGTNMAGFSIQEMKSLLENKKLPDNIILPKEFEVRDDVKNTSTATNENEYSVDSYLWYGKMYGIALGKDGKAVDVIDYKGKEQAKNKIIDAYNLNPNLDVQSGKLFRNNNSSNQTTNNTNLNILNGSVITNVINNTININGVNLDLGNITLNKGQNEAMQNIANFIDSNITSNNLFDLTYTLQGYAGTGKTTITKFIVQYVEKKYKSYLLSSPTHRAKEVLMDLTGKNAMTLAKALGLSAGLELDNFNLQDKIFNSKNPIKIPINGLLIVDEASMINDDLYETILEEASKRGTKVLFIGDEAQLKPVKQKTKSKAFLRDKNINKLTEVMRTSDSNPMPSEVLQPIRDNESSTIDMFEHTNKLNSNNEGIKFTSSESEWLKNMLQEFTLENLIANPNHIRALAYTNKRVEELNTIIRNKMFGIGSDLYYKNELMMMYENLKMLPGGDYMYSNGQDVIVDSYVFIKDYKIISPTGKSFTVPGHLITFKDAKTKKLKQEPLFVADMNTVSRDYLDELKFLKNQAVNASNYSRSEKWGNYYTFSSSYNLTRDVYEVGGNIYTFQQDALKALNAIIPGATSEMLGKYKVKDKSIDYSYAHTIHKSQGGTYNYSYVDENNIDIARRFPKLDYQLINQLKYVGFSRSSKLTYSLSQFANNDTNIIKDSLINTNLITFEEFKNTLNKNCK